jgi:hypothetical protein
LTMTRAVAGAELASLALWIVPIAVVQIVRLRRDRTAWQMALDVPFAVALDLLTILTMTRLVRLEQAALLSRPLWILGGTSVTLWRKRRGLGPAWPSAVHFRDLLAAALAAGLAVAACSNISHKYLVWDMEWHAPLVTTLGGQKLPFVNALSPREVLHYHFAGDVLAAVVRALSFDVLSAPRALHVAHDAMFAAIAGSVTLLWIGLGQRRWWPAVLGGVAVVLQGPIPIRGGLGHPFYGYAYHDFVGLSYRPHVPLAGLLMVGAIGTLAARAVWPEKVSARATLPVLFATIGLLAVTDEASTAILGLALGVAWCVDGRLIAGRRMTGALTLAGLALAFVGANLLFAASLAPGSPVQKVALTLHARMPPLLLPDPSLPLSTPDGRTAFIADFLPLLAGAAALAALAAKLRSRASSAIAVFAWTSVAVSAVLVTRLEINHDPAECQRFFLAPFFACVVLTVVSIHRFGRGSWGAMMAMLGTAVPAIYSIYCTREVAPLRMADRSDGPLPRSNVPLNGVDCRESAGAHLGDRPKVAYVEASQFLFVVSCRPIFTWGSPLLPWPVRMQPVVAPLAQLRVLDENLVDRNTDLDAICPSNGITSDDVCRQALRSRSRCRAEGSQFLRCVLTPLDRNLLLGRGPQRGT